MNDFREQVISLKSSGMSYGRVAKQLGPGQTVLIPFVVLRQPLDDHNQPSKGLWVVRPVSGGEESVVNEENVTSPDSGVTEIREVLAWASENVWSIHHWPPDGLWIIYIDTRSFSGYTLYEILLAAWRATV